MDLVAVALDQASGDDQLLGAADLLVLGHFENGVDGFLFCGIDEAAGVDDEDVGLIRMRRQLMPVRGELPHHDFAVHEILGTAQTDKADFQVRISSEGDVLNQDIMGAAEGTPLTDREKAGLRGAVRRVVAETWRADWQTTVMPEKPVTQETIYLSDGRLQEQSYQAPNGHNSITKYIYDADDRLSEVRWSSPGSEHLTHYAYDQQGRLVRLTAWPAGEQETIQETNSYSADGARTNVHYYRHVEAKGGAVGWDLRIEGSELGLGAPNGGSTTTVYDSRGYPVESLAHTDRHGLIVRVKYICDERGHIVEEMAEPGHDPVGSLPDDIPEEARAIFQKVFASYLLQGQATHKYDEVGNRIEMVRDSGPRKETRRTRFNEHGDKILEESESVDRHMDFDMQGAEIPETVKTYAQHTIARFEYTYDEHGNWIEQTQWTSAEPGQAEFRSMLVRRTLTYF